MNSEKVLMFTRAMFFALAIFSAKQSLAVDTACPRPEPDGSYGPYDYITQKDKLAIVEGAHFQTETATLVRSKHGVIGDLGYTLHAFPNHHRALESLLELALQKNSTAIDGMTFTIPCYFIRASKFVPTDGMVNAIYANYLARIGQKDMAKSEADLAIKKTPNNPRVAYNIGLAYYYLGDYKTARVYSDMAKKLGSSAVGLDKLLSKSVPQTQR